MTREEVVEHLDTIGQYYSQDHSDPYDECERLTKDELDAIYLAIKALEQEPETGHWITKESIKANMDEVLNELEMIFSDIREKNVDDSVCGLCEYDCDHGLDGYANECPGFERDDCFKLKEEYRNEWINKIIGEVTE